MELASVGYFIKTHGVKGQIILKIEHQFKEKDVKVLFIETATGKAPFFVNGFKNNNHGLIFSLEEITSVEQAKKLIGKDKTFFCTCALNSDIKCCACILNTFVNKKDVIA